MDKSIYFKIIFRGEKNETQTIINNRHGAYPKLEKLPTFRVANIISINAGTTVRLLFKSYM
jgi:hypothetical protein